MRTAIVKIYLPSQFLITLLLVMSAAEISVAASSEQESADIISSLSTTDQLNEKLNTYRDLLPNDPDSIIHNILPVLDLFVDSGDPEIAARANWLVGVSYYFRGEYLISNYYYDKVLLMDQADVSQSLQASIHNNRGVNYELLGKLEMAIDSYQRSLQIENASGNVIGKAQTEMNIGILLNKIGELDRAIEKTERALAVFTELDDSFHVALASMNLGSYYSIAGKEPAFELLTRAKERFEELGSDRYVTTSQFRLARYFTERGDYEKAIEYTSKTLERLEGTSFTDVHVRTLTLMISLQDLVGNTDQSIHFIEQVTAAVEDELISAPDLLTDFWEVATRIYSQLGKVNEIADLISIQSSFEESVNQQLNLALLNQFEILNDISPTYATEVAENYPELGIGSYKLSTFVLLILVIALTLGAIGGGAYLFRGYLPIPGRDSRTDYMIQRIKSQKDDKDAVQPDYSVVEASKSGYKDEGKGPDLTDSVSKLFPEIDQLMMKEQLFKNPDLSREYLAKRLRTNTKYISMAVKKETGLSFNDYVNSCAISLAVAKIKNTTTYRSLTNMELAEECGYSSETTFYRNFRKLTGLTPSQFKKRYHGEKAH